MKNNNITKSFDEINKLLPFSYPFLLIDKVLEVELGKRILTQKCVSGQDPFIQGHFKDGPAIVPGVLLIESINQSAFVLSLLSGLTNTDDWSHYLAETRSVFRGIVRPGDLILFEITINDIVSQGVSYTGIGKVNDRMVVKSINTSVIKKTG